MARKVRIGVLGAGRWGPNLIRNFHSDPASTVVAVADSNRSRLELLKERYGDVRLTTSSGEVIGSDDVDAVVICTPTATHFELASKALKAGKHVFVEKPLAREVKECETLIRLASKARRVLFVGHVFVYNAGVQAVREYIRKGALGKIFHIQVRRTNLGPVRTDVSALWDLASHDLSILDYWLGEMPTKVSAVGGRFLSGDLEDTVFATYTFPSKTLANIHVSWLSPKKVREITVVGSKKMLVWNDMQLERPLELCDLSITVDSVSGEPAGEVVDTFQAFRSSIHEGETVVPKIALNEPLSAECKAFLKALKDPKSSLSGGLEGKRVVQALVATDASIWKNGREVEIGYSR